MEEIDLIPNSGRYLSTLSGGLDSALLTFLVLKNKPECQIVLSTICFAHMQDYNLPYVKNIRQYLDTQFPGRIIAHRIGFLPDRETAINGGKAKQTKQLVEQYNITGILSGMTKNPPELQTEGRDETRDVTREWCSMSRNGIYHYQPFINRDKRSVAQLYQQLDLQELADLTISCEALERPRPCKKCWWCKEKHWAFGYY